MVSEFLWKRHYFFFWRKNKERVQINRGQKNTAKTLIVGIRGIRLFGLHSYTSHWLSLWAGASNFFLSLSFSICQNDKFRPHITQALYGTWPSVTLSVLFIFHIFTPGERTICWFTKKQTITKVNPLLSVLKFFWATTASRDWLVYIESMPFTTSISGWNGTGILWRPLFWIGEGHSDIGISAWG